MGMLLWGLLVGGLAVDQAAPPPAPISPPSQSAGPVETAKSQTGNLVSLFSNDDYPDAAIRNGEQGDVQVRLSINAQGIVDDCTIIESSNSAALDTATCSILARRARFRPARDAAGNAVGDTYTQRVRWRLPEDDDQAGRLADVLIRARLDLDRKGRVVACQYLVGGEELNPLTQGPPCARYQPIVDRIIRSGGRNLPSPLRTLVLDTAVDFGPQDMPVSELSDAKLLGDARFTFEMAADGRSFAACKQVERKGKVLPEFTCEGGPAVRLPEGQTMEVGVYRTGTIRGRVWVLTGGRSK